MVGWSDFPNCVKPQAILQTPSAKYHFIALYGNNNYSMAQRATDIDITTFNCITPKKIRKSQYELSAIICCENG